MAQVQTFYAHGDEDTTINLSVESANELASYKVTEDETCVAALVCTDDGILLRSYTK